MSDLPPGLKDFGDRLEEAARRDISERAEPASRRERRSRRALRNIGLPVTAALVAAAVSAGAVRLGDREAAPISPERGAGTSYRPAEDTAVVEASAVADPGGGPPWVVRTYSTPRGGACVQVGQLREGKFGQVQSGRFRKLPATTQQSCAGVNHSGPLFAVARRPAVNLTLVFGLAPGGRAVTIDYGNTRRRARPVSFGAFLAIFKGSDPRQRIIARVRVGGVLHEQRFGR
jgi:hypothetical protein